MLWRKYEVEEKHVYKLCGKQLKNAVNNEKYNGEWYFDGRY